VQRDVESKLLLVEQDPASTGELMNVVEVASQFIVAIEACNRVLTQSRAALKVLRPFLKRAFPDIVYEKGLSAQSCSAWHRNL
jgi:hypothetical protein